MALRLVDPRITCSTAADGAPRPRRAGRAALAALALGAALLVHGPAAAGDKVAAESLFREGKRLLDAKDYAKACRAFAASHKADPSVGALVNLARCQELRGQSASAWATFNDAAAMAAETKDPEREKGAKEHVARLEPTLSKLTIQIEGATPDLVVERDGAPVPAEAFGLAVAVDPGSHRVVARAPGRQPWETTVEVAANRDSQTIQIPALPPGEGDTEPGGGGTSGVAIAGYVLIGVGGAGLIVGTAMGIRAIGQRNELRDHCTATDPATGKLLCTTPEDQATRQELTEKTAPIATAGLAIGGAAAVAGVLMVLLAPSSDSAEPGDESAPASSALWLLPAASPEGVGLAVGGRF